jgi:CRP-like cAMP-binding protein
LSKKGKGLRVILRKMSEDITKAVKAFFKNYPSRTFEKGEKLIQPEESLVKTFYLVEGRVSQYDITLRGNLVVVNIFKPGAFFPMSNAINGTSNHYFFEASTKVKARVAPAEEAVAFLKANPQITFDLLSRVYRGMDGVLRRMAHLMGGDVKSRLIFELLNSAYRFGELRPDGSIFMNINESELAKHSGLARETVSRNVQTLKAASLVQIRPDGIILKKPAKLESMLGDDI